MRLIKVGASTLNQTPLDWSGNRARIEGALRDAHDADVSVLCLPEMCLTGYGCEDAFFSTDVQGRALAMLESLLPMTAGMVVTFGLPLLFRNALFNAIAVVADGEVLGFVAKQNLAGDGVHYEPRWFKSWAPGESAEVRFAGQAVPLGDLHFDVGGVRLGLEICEDAWVAERVGGPLARRGVDIMLNPSASHFAFGKRHIRERFTLEGSRAFGVTYIHSNLVGNEAGRVIFEGGSLIATAGDLVARGPRLHFAERVLTTAVVDIDKTRMIQSRTASFQPDMRPQDERWCVSALELPEAAIEPTSSAPCPWAVDPEREKLESFTRAEALALFDYLRKSYSRGFVVSLSGGADSAAVTVLASAAIRLAVSELGFDVVRERLSYAKAFAEANDVDELVQASLTCAYQATRNSGDTTRRAARSVADGVGARLHFLDVDAIVEGYTAMIERTLGRQLTWETDDIALQNIQARVRSPSIWMLANIQGALLLATSNRSEAAVGYATMDGDTSGGLSPIAGIDKAFLRAWLRWMESDGPQELSPVAALHAVNVQQPTAELRPPNQDQTDEGDLMPYPILDEIERAAIRDKQSPVDVFRLLQARHPELAVRQLHGYVVRFFRLWSRNQWKRERYAPSFHLDDENLDPKTWCRFPILSGGFTEELATLERYVNAIA